MKINQELQVQFDKMCAGGKLFVVDTNDTMLWNAYLKGFPEDKMFKDPNSSVHNCNKCNSFLTRYGNIVALDKNLNIITMFDNITDPEYKEALTNVAKYVRSCNIKNVFTEHYSDLVKLQNQHGIRKSSAVFNLGRPQDVKRYTKQEADNYPGIIKANEVRAFDHLHTTINKCWINFSNKSTATILSANLAKAELLGKALSIISISTITQIQELIETKGVLFEIEQYAVKLNMFKELKEAYKGIPEEKRFNFIWKTSADLDVRLVGFKNSLIGTLCTDIEEGEKTLDHICREWNKRVDPVNFNKAKSTNHRSSKKKRC